jgi:hypothetical protein
MQNTGAANAVSKSVSFQLSVDAYMPADTYTGNVQYNAIPTY